MSRCTTTSASALFATGVNGASVRDVAGRHGLTKSSVHRHAETHFPAALTRAHRAQEVARGDALLEQVLDLRDRALAVLAQVEGAQDHRSALAAIREARGCVELLAKLAGELDERPVVNVENVFATVEWQQVQALVLEVLEPHPEARRRFVDGLGVLEERDRHGR